MILNNFYGKFDEGVHFHKIFEKNIDLSKFEEQHSMSTDKSKQFSNPIKNLKSDSSKKIDTSNEVSRTDNKRLGKQKNKLSDSNTKQVSSLDFDSGYEKHEEQKRNRFSNRSQLFTAMTIDAKLATNTSILNLKSPINYNIKKIGQDAIKFPKLIEQDSNSNKVPFNINRLLPRNRNDEDFSLPQISNKKPMDNQLCLRSEKAYLVDKNKLIDENLIDFGCSRKKPIEIFSENQFSKQNFEIFLRNKNRRKEHMKEIKPIKSRKISKAIKKEKFKTSIKPSVKFSEVNEKVYLDIFIPTVV